MVLLQLENDTQVQVKLSITAIECSQQPGTWLTLPGTDALVDTAAGSGLLGLPFVVRAMHSLKEKGRRLILIAKDIPPATGIGGNSKPLGVALIPTGIEKENGVIELYVLEQDVPPLLPVAFLDQLEATISIKNITLHLEQLGVTTAMSKYGSGHRAINIQIFQMSHSILLPH
jgi:hypothetical protein